MEQTANSLLKEFFPSETANTTGQLELIRRTHQQYNEPDDLPFTQQEVDLAIKREDDNKSPGEDGLSAAIIFHCSKIYPKLYLNLFNRCLEAGLFPERWKKSIVKLIPKSSTNDHSVKSFRPMSLLDVTGKILEKLVYDRLTYSIFSPPCLMSPRQFGFTQQKSAEDAINEIVKLQTRIIEQKKLAYFVSLDIQGAFDSAWWPLILNSLREHRVPENLYRLVEDYFSNRKATLPLCRQNFGRRLERGCPQGAKCSPLFWNLLYNSLLELPMPDQTYIQAFADDAFLVCEGTQIRECAARTNAAL
ncbi:RNA-directed DNA polymerase, partial [Clostridioides difficile]|uniref:RNA-directed DNA polymerase n=1 Tax=Clostridioides difficile TaxID=1496 RepID=UPI0013EFB73C